MFIISMNSEYHVICRWRTEGRKGFGRTDNAKSEETEYCSIRPTPSVLWHVHV